MVGERARLLVLGTVVAAAGCDGGAEAVRNRAAGTPAQDAAGSVVVDAGAGGGAGGGTGGGGTGGGGAGGGGSAGAAGGAGSGGMPGRVAPLPFGVDDFYATSGYMGDGVIAGGVTDVSACTVARQGSGRGRCHRFIWTPGAMGWAGIFWQYPEGNWGASPGLQIATGARQVSYYAWGDRGGERVTFFVGMDAVDGFSVRNVDIVLGTAPTLYTLDLGGVAYDRVVGGFGWTIGGAGFTGPATFFVDDIEWR